MEKFEKIKEHKDLNEMTNQELEDKKQEVIEIYKSTKKTADNIKEEVLSKPYKDKLDELKKQIEEIEKIEKFRQRGYG